MKSSLYYCRVSLILSLLCLSQLFATAYAIGERSSTTLGSKYGVDGYEIELDSNISAIITQYAQGAHYNPTYNWYGANTTTNNIYLAASGVGAYSSISFYIGHGSKDGWPLLHWFFIDASGNKVYDRDVFAYSENYSVEFALLWSCFQGDTEGGYYGIWPFLDPYGMPHGWLHDAALCSDGYANPSGLVFTFIGFTGPAPYLWTFIIDPSEGHAGYRFLERFYYYTLLFHDKTINQALDFASYSIWSCSFGDSCLYQGFDKGAPPKHSRMVVYGDGSKCIHSSLWGGGGGCPTLYIWNGIRYVDYGVIDIHDPSGTDIKRQVTVNSQDVAVNHNRAKFKLLEGWLGLNFSESLMDQTKLYAIDSNGNKVVCPLIKAMHCRLGNVLPQLLLDDEWKIQSLLLETTDLEFLVPLNNAKAFIFMIEGCNYKIP